MLRPPQIGLKNAEADEPWRMRNSDKIFATALSRDKYQNITPQA
jgi:hypothetical protein